MAATTELQVCAGDGESTRNDVVESSAYEPARLDALLELLKRATLGRHGTSAPDGSKVMRWVDRTCLGVFALAIMTLLGLAAWKQYGSTPHWFELALALTVTVYVLDAAVYLLLIVCFSIATAIHLRKRPYAAMFEALKQDMHRDALLVNELQAYDRDTLSYASIQYRHCWLSFHSRITTMTGDIRRLGLFPAFVGLSASLIAVWHTRNLFPWWALIVVTAALYLFSCLVVSTNDRAKQVGDLLDYVIRNKGSRKQ